jgi:hypothetical protein
MKYILEQITVEQWYLKEMSLEQMLVKFALKF